MCCRHAGGGLVSIGGMVSKRHGQDRIVDKHPALRHVRGEIAALHVHVETKKLAGTMRHGDGIEPQDRGKIVGAKSFAIRADLPIIGQASADGCYHWQRAAAPERRWTCHYTSNEFTNPLMTATASASWSTVYGLAASARTTLILTPG